MGMVVDMYPIAMEKILERKRKAYLHNILKNEVIEVDPLVHANEVANANDIVINLVQETNVYLELVAYEAIEANPAIEVQNLVEKVLEKIDNLNPDMGTIDLVVEDIASNANIVHRIAD